MVHYIYKVSNSEGEFYIGRHSTNDINDGYMGSGNWVQSIDNTQLSKEILVYADTFKKLTILEEQHISSNFQNPNCKNINLASVGWTPDDAKRIVLQQIKDGKNALTGKRGSQLASETNKKRLENGTHPFLENGNARKIINEMFKNGTHPFNNGTKTKERIKKQIAKDHFNNIFESLNKFN